MLLKASPWFSNWLDRRIPRTNEITLTQRRIFILPTQAGIGFLCLAAGLLLAGINYENNMLFAFAFFVIGIFLVSILHTYTNLAGLSLRLVGADPAFCDQHAEFRFLLTNAGERQYHSIHLSWPQSDIAVTSLVKDRQTRVSLFVPAKQRGLLKMERLKVESRYPLGIFRAWTWLDFNANCLIYPKPVASSDYVPVSTATHDGGNYVLPDGNEEFAGFVDYQPGDSLKQVAWRNVARGLPVLTRQYQSAADRRLWIEWTDADSFRVETALSRMCHQVLEADAQRLEYGLRLPGVEIPPGLGDAHQLKTLQALALFRQGD